MIATAIWPVSGSLLGDGGSHSSDCNHECNNSASFEAECPAAALTADSADSLAEWQDDLAKGRSESSDDQGALIENSVHIKMAAFMVCHIVIVALTKSAVMTSVTFES